MKIRIIKPTKLGTLIFILFSWKSTLDKQKRVRPKVSVTKKKKNMKNTHSSSCSSFSIASFANDCILWEILVQSNAKPIFHFDWYFVPLLSEEGRFDLEIVESLYSYLIHFSSSNLEEKGKYYEMDQQNYSIPSLYIMIICKKRWAKLWE